jgi:hypothetical protein
LPAEERGRRRQRLGGGDNQLVILKGDEVDAGIGRGGEDEEVRPRVLRG